MPEDMSYERRTGISDSMQEMRSAGSITPQIDMGLESAKGFFQPTSINKSSVALGESQVAVAKNEPQPIASKEMPDIRNQLGGGDDENDPVKARLEHERRMSSMFGERGATGHMNQMIRGARNLQAIEKGIDVEKGEFRADQKSSYLDKVLKDFTNPPARGQKSGITYVVSDTSAQAEAGLKVRVKNLKRLVGEEKAKTKGRNESFILRAESALTSAEYSLTKEKEDLLNREREKIMESYVAMTHVFASEINDINKYLEDLKNPYPYDSRWTIQMAKDSLDRINASIRERKGLNKEARTILKMIKQDCRWLMATARHMEAMGPSFETYFDGEMEITQLRSQRSEILAGDHRRMLGKNMRGLAFTPSEREIIKNLLTKLPSEYTEIEGTLERTFREEAVELQDRAGEWILKIAAAHQKNFEYGFEIGPDGNPLDPEMGENYAVIDEVTYRFLAEVLNVGNAPGERYLEDGVDNPDKFYVYRNSQGKEFKVARTMLNPYAMDQSDEYAVMYLNAVLHEIVKDRDLTDVLRRIGQEDREKWDTLLDEQTAKIIAQANWRIAKEDSLDELGVNDRLADTVAKSMVILEKGTFACGDMGWGWKHNKVKMVEGGEWSEDAKKIRGHYKWLFKVFDKNYKDSDFETRFNSLIQGTGDERFMVIRKKDMGSIYDNHDITTVFYPAEHVIAYDAMADDRGVIWYATVGWYRELWDYMPPYWKPEMRVFAADEPEMLENFGVDSDGNVHVEKGIQKLMGEDLRKDYGPASDGRPWTKFSGINEKTADFINRNVWVLKTWTLKNPGVKGSAFNGVPIFLPTSTPELNYWRTTSLVHPSAKIDGKTTVNGQNIVYGKNSIWHERLKGKKYSEFDWDNMPRYRFNYHRVTLEQLERWYGPLITPHMYNRFTGEQYEEHHDNPNGLAMAHKRSGKRYRLGKRLDPEGAGVYRAAVLPQNNAFTVARESGLFAIKGGNPLVVQQQIEDKREIWATPTMNTYLDMPPVVLKINKYGQTAMAMFLLTYYQLENIAESQRIMSIGQEQQVGNAADRMLRKLKGRSTPSTVSQVNFDGAEEEKSAKTTE
jgi:hypothetical protein